MLPTVIDSTANPITTTANVSVPRPTLADGCTVLILVDGRGQGTVSVPFAGFEAVPSASGQTSTGASGARVTTFRRYVEVAAGEPANYTCTWDSSLHGSVTAVSIANADPTAPIDVALVQLDAGVSPPSDATVVSPSVTTADDDRLIIRHACMTTSVGVASWASPDCTEIEDVASAVSTNRCSGATGWEDQVAAGATGTATWTVTLVGGSTSYGSALGLTVAVAGTQVIADAGGPQDVEPGDTVQLDSSASTGDITSRLWTQLSGDVTVILADADQEVATFVAPKPPTSDPMDLVFQVAANGPDDSDTATTTVTVTPTAAPSLGVFRLDANGDPA